MSAIPFNLVGILTPEEIARGTVCGFGGFGEVSWLDHPAIGKVAVKRLLGSHDRTMEDQRRRALREAKIWQGLRHPGILSFIGVLETDQSLYIVSRFAENGALDRFLRLNPSTNRLRMIGEIASALAYLHVQGVVHGDIKAANVLVSNDIRPLVCDFGLSRAIDAVTATTLQGKGSLRWMSPELLAEGHGKSFATDVWAFGMLIYEILSGYLPFYNIPDHGLFGALLLKHIRPPTEPAQAANGVSYANAWDFARRCWNDDPALRPTMNQAEEQLAYVNPEHQPLHNSPKPRILQGHTGPVFGLAFSPDSRLLVSVSADKSVRLWDALTAKPVGNVMNDYHINDINAVSFSPSGSQIASGSDDGYICLWDVQATKRVQAFNGRGQGVYSVKYSPDSRILAGAYDDDTIKFWDPRTDDRNALWTAELKGHMGTVSCLAFSPDGRTLVSGSFDRMVCTWDVGSRRQIGAALAGHTDWVRGIALSPDGKRIASASHDGTIRFWDPATGKQILDGGIKLDGKTQMRSVAFSPDGDTLACASSRHTVQLWDVAVGRTPKKIVNEELDGHADELWGVAFSPDGNWLATASWDRTIQVWDVHEVLKQSR